MRLINVNSLELEDVWDEKVKKYAILSHRWENEEVTFQDMQDQIMARTMKVLQKSKSPATRLGKMVTSMCGWILVASTRTAVPN